MSLPAGAQPIDVIPPSGQWVTDHADLLTPTEERSLTTKLRAYADTTSTQIIVVTLPELGGVDASQYATELGQRWGVGQGDADNGAVVLVSRDDRQVFIATGYGLEGAVPDVLAGRIVRNLMVPNFREGRFYAGIAAAADAIMQAAAGEFTVDDLPEPAGGDGGDNTALIFILVILAYFVLSSIRRGGRGGGKRYRRGSGPVVIWGGGGGGGFSGGGFGGGGFSGGGGGFGGGGAGGSW